MKFKQELEEMIKSKELVPFELLQRESVVKQEELQIALKNLLNNHHFKKLILEDFLEGTLEKVVNLRKNGKVSEAETLLDSVITLRNYLTEIALFNKDNYKED